MSDDKKVAAGTARQLAGFLAGTILKSREGEVA
jgi:hypothetical protein